MIKFNCSCGNRTFTVDEKNAGRIVCDSCGKHYFWNGKAFQETTRLQKVISMVKSILRIEKKPVKLEPKEFGEALTEKPVKVKRKHLPQKTAEKYMVPYKTQPKRHISWCKPWHDFVLSVVKRKCVYVGKHEHVGGIRGKHIIKEAHRRFNFLGLKSAADFKRNSISFLDDKEKAIRALEEIKVWR